jgi:hypothetical protein
MATITSTRQLVLAQGPSTALADLLSGRPVVRVYRLLPGGNWVSYQASMPDFAAFSTLENNNFYFIISASTGYDLPGVATEASLGAAIPIAAPTLSTADPNTGNLRLAVPAGTTIDEVKLAITPTT